MVLQMVLQVLRVLTSEFLPELLLVVNLQELKVDQVEILLVLRELLELVHRPKKRVINYRGYHIRLDQMRYIRKSKKEEKTFYFKW